MKNYLLKVAGNAFRLCFPAAFALPDTFAQQYGPFMCSNPTDAAHSSCIGAADSSCASIGQPSSAGAVEPSSCTSIGQPSSCIGAAEPSSCIGAAEPDRILFELRCVPDSFANMVDIPADSVSVFTQQGDRQIPLAFTHDSRGWLMRMAPGPGQEYCCALRMTEDFGMGVFSVSDPYFLMFGLDSCAMIMYAFRAVEHRTLLMHASVVTCQGRAYLFLGESGTGKSTHSRMWLENIEGTELLNDDNPIVRILPDGVHAYGSPWSGKTACYKNSSAPIGAFVSLRQAAENRLRRIDLFESYATLLSSCSGLKLGRKAGSMSDLIHPIVESIITQIPTFTLDCLPTPAAAHLCFSGIAAC